MRTTNPRIALVIGALFLAAACDEPRGSPTAPTAPIAPGPTTPSVTSLTISGNTSIAAPGGTSQLTATARYSDDTTQDVTAEAQWRSSNNDPLTDVVSVISRGLIRAEHYGKGGVRATYASGQGLASASAEVRVAPDGVFLVTVAVSDGQWAAEGVRVQVNSPAGTYIVETDLWGVICLPAVGDAMLQAEKAGFRTIRKPLTVSNDQVIDVVLQRSDGASSTSAPPIMTLSAKRLFPNSGKRQKERQACMRQAQVNSSPMRCSARGPARAEVFAALFGERLE